MSPEVEEIIKAAGADEGKPVSAWLAEAATEEVRAAGLHAAGRAAGVAGTIDAIVIVTAVRH